MKKMICLALALMLCASMMLPVMAAEALMIPSLAMEIVSAEINGEDVTDALVATTIPDAEDKKTDILQEDRDGLLAAYQELSSGKIELPTDSNYVYKNMIALSFLTDASEEMKQNLAKDGASVTVTLKSEADNQEDLAAFVKLDDEWVPALMTQLNGDGTITCKLENAGPVVLVQMNADETEPEEDYSIQGQDTPGIFVPSIGYKPGPKVVVVISNIEFGDGIPQNNDNLMNCIAVTSVEQAIDRSTDISQAERDLLISLYNDLRDGTTQLPLEKQHVIRELFDIRFALEGCREKEGHQVKIENLKEKGVTLTVTFDLGVAANAKLLAMAYNEEKGEWEPVVSLENNGDRTVTCVIEDVAPVVFLTDGNGNSASPWTGDVAGNNLGIWIGVMVICAGALVALIVLGKKKK